ncbi:MAG: SAM-dependent methyltransferase [Parcubacteria bacterium C7867-008]|nr:MAG: SAM-dependent methyltransferase [Parcubacteria bacterium C7867-008]
MSLWKNWKDFYELTKDKPPRRLIVQAMPHVQQKESALDLGAGALNDSIYLLGEGFAHVTAEDAEPLATEIADKLPADKFTYVVEKMESFTFRAKEYDLVNAQYTLPFLHPDQFEKVWSEIIRSLKTGGIFTGQFFGDRDEWQGKDTMTFHTRAEAEKLLEKLTVLEFEEEEVDKPTAAGIMKHWHVFHFIARVK